MITPLFAVKYSRVAIILLLLCMHVAGASGQVKQPPAPQDIEKPIPKLINFKVLEEYKDGKGNMIRTIQYDKGNMRVTETIIKPIIPTYNLHKPIKGDTLVKDSVYLMVSKSRYRVDVYYKNKMIRSYAAVFGPRPLENKCMEGDRCTPEGWYKIKLKNPASQYNKFMLLDYPNDSTIKRFTALKAKGSLPANAKMGGNVGIHGIWKGGDDMIELGVGWTDGCVALKNADVDELYTFVGVGTKVCIKR